MVLGGLRGCSSPSLGPQPAEASGSWSTVSRDCEGGQNCGTSGLGEPIGAPAPHWLSNSRSRSARCAASLWAVPAPVLPGQPQQHVDPSASAGPAGWAGLAIRRTNLKAQHPIEAIRVGFWWARMSFQQGQPIALRARLACCESASRVSATAARPLAQAGFGASRWVATITAWVGEADPGPATDQIRAGDWRAMVRSGATADPAARDHQALGPSHPMGHSIPFGQGRKGAGGRGVAGPEACRSAGSGSRSSPGFCLPLRP